MTKLGKNYLASKDYGLWLDRSNLDKIEAKEPHRKQIVQESYSNWLESMDWDFFCTYTTNYELTLKSARRIMERYHKKLKANYSDTRFFWVAEPFDCKEGFHTHALLYFNDRNYKNISISNRSLDFELGRKSWSAVNPNSANSYCKLERFKPSRGATSYVGKYMNKYRSDYDLLI